MKTKALSVGDRGGGRTEKFSALSFCTAFSDTPSKRRILILLLGKDVVVGELDRAGLPSNSNANCMEGSSWLVLLGSDMIRFWMRGCAEDRSDKVERGRKVGAI